MPASLITSTAFPRLQHKGGIQSSMTVTSQKVKYRDRCYTHSVQIRLHSTCLHCYNHRDWTMLKFWRLRWYSSIHTPRYTSVIPVLPCNSVNITHLHCNLIMTRKIPALFADISKCLHPLPPSPTAWTYHIFADLLTHYLQNKLDPRALGDTYGHVLENNVLSDWKQYQLLVYLHC